MIRKSPGMFLLAWVVMGIVLADQLRPEAEWLLPLAVAAALAGLLRWRWSPSWAVIGLAVSLAGSSACHFALKHYDLGPNHLEYHYVSGETYECYGEVADWPLLTPTGTRIQIALDSLEQDGYVQVVKGGLLLNVYEATTDLQRGDRVIFRTRLYDLPEGSWPGDFNYRRFLSLKGVFAAAYVDNLISVRVNNEGRWKTWELVDRLRHAIVATFQRHLSEETAALAAGFLIGETRHIPPDIYQMFRDSGTLHLLAVSGSNVALVVLFVVVLLRPLRLDRRWRAVILLIVIAIFDLLCFAEPSVMRSSIMAAMVILAGLVGRRYDLNNIIALAALMILLVDPAQLYSVGFQLSFLTAWGLIAVVTRLSRWIHPHLRRRWLWWLVAPLVVTVVAQIASAPLLAFYFQRLPLISPLANLVVVPLVSLAVVSSIGLLLIELVVPVFSPWVGPALEQLMNLILLAVRGFGGDHIPVLATGQPSAILTVTIYVLLVMAVLAISRPKLRRWTMIAIVSTIALVGGGSLSLSGGEDVVREYFVFRSPAGTAVLKTELGSSSVDLIVLGAQARRYPLDERILAPALKAVGAERLGWLIVCDADYAALDDLLRLATRFEADSVGVAEHLHKACLDHILREETPFEVARLVPFGDSGVMVGHGVWLAADNCLVEDPPLVIEYSFDSRTKSTRAVPSEYSLVRIASDPAGLSLFETSEWLEEGVDMVVCAKLEQPSSSGRPDWVQGERLWDLRRQGTLRIRIHADSAGSVEFGHVD
jgi:ComEC/Rec2-related protein